ncbi:MAG: urea ABC transporter permease subunit UrtB, partial [Rhodospirillaceae bacterium]|nr:urea ABC transporter permease subunit UrtB [Rhodospirillaceae bacterium]
TGDPRAQPVLEALAGRSLYVTEDGRVVIGEDHPDGLRLIDPLTGEEVGIVGSREVDRVRANNSLRSTARSAIGTLTLMSPDPAIRRGAAETVFRSQDAGALSMLDQALAGEEDDEVRAAMEKARAAILLGSDDPALRLEAVEALREFTDPDIRSMLAALVVQRQDGTYAETDETVRAAAAESLEAIERKLAAWRIAGYVYQGISLGSVLLLAAIGLAITFGVMGVINMAHGEMVMIGAYTTFVIQEVIRNHAPELLDWSLFVAIPAAFVVAGLAGIAIERGIIRFLYGRPLETLLATWGLSLILRQLVRTLFGTTNQEVGTPSWMQGAIETTAGVTMTYNRLYIILFCLLVFAGLMVALRRTALGLQMRAVTQNRQMARAMGIRTGRVDALTFGLGSGIAGIAGVALSQIDNVSPNLGQGYIIDSFLVVVFGGVGNLWGTLAGAFSLGVANKLLEPYAGAVLGKILVLVAIILFIQKRPRGLFALRGRAVEA